MRKFLFLIISFFVFSLTFSQVHQAGEVDEDFIGSDSGNGITGGVYQSEVLSNGKVLISGNFIYFDGTHLIEKIALLNSDGSPDTSFQPDVSNFTSVNFTVLSNGKILIFGAGTAPLIKRINTDGSTDSGFDFSINPEYPIKKLAVQNDGKILVAETGKLYRLLPDGQLDSGFITGNTSGDISGEIKALKIQTNGKILVGGVFKEYNDQAVKFLCRLESDGEIDAQFSQNLDFRTTSNVGVNSINIQNDGKIIVTGGLFLNAVNTNGLIRLNSDGSTDTTFSNDFTNLSITDAILLDNGKIIIAGNYLNEYNNTTINKIARINANGQLDATFSISEEFDFNSFSAQNQNSVLIGGLFQNKEILKKFSQSGAPDNSLSFFVPFTGLNGTVKIIKAMTNGQFMILGDFTQFNGNAAKQLIRTDSEGNRDLGFVLDESVSSTIKIEDFDFQPNGKIIAWYTVPGISGSNLLRLNTDGSVDSSFQNVIGAYFANMLNGFRVLPDGKIFAYGSNANESYPTIIARFNQDGSFDDSYNLDPFFSTVSYCLVDTAEIQEDGKILVSLFYAENVGDVYQMKIFRLNPDGSIDNGFDSVNFNLDVHEVRIQNDGKIIVGGYFGGSNSYGDFPFYGVARLNQDGSLDYGFDPTNPDWIIKRVDDMLIQEEEQKIVLTGYFQMTDGSRMNGIVRFDMADGSIDPNFESYFFPSTVGKAGTIALQSNNKIWVGSGIRKYKETRKNFLFRIYGEGLTHVPDGNFEQALINLGLDDEINEYVLTRNITPVTTLDLNSKAISDLTGIQDFSSLNHLDIRNNELTNLNLIGKYEEEEYFFYNNKSLKYLNVSNNQLTKLIVSQLPELNELYVTGNQLDQLDVKNGNNINFFGFNSINNPDLICIQVDDADWSEANWTEIDEWTSFSKDCENMSVADQQVQKLILYPNPTNGLINFSEKVWSVSVYDLTGKVLKSYDFPVQSISISDLMPGIYVIKTIQKGGKKGIHKVIKK